MRRVTVTPELCVVDRAADVEHNQDRRECLPAGRIALLRFSLAEVEQLTEDERPSPLA